MERLYPTRTFEFWRPLLALPKQSMNSRFCQSCLIWHRIGRRTNSWITFSVMYSWTISGLWDTWTGWAICSRFWSLVEVKHMLAFGQGGCSDHLKYCCTLMHWFRCFAEWLAAYQWIWRLLCASKLVSSHLNGSICDDTIANIHGNGWLRSTGNAPQAYVSYDTWTVIVGTINCCEEGLAAP